MNKQQYLMDLESALRAKKVQDIEDILGEYEQHFALKMMDGHSEEEVSNRLENPSLIAEQFSMDEKTNEPQRNGGKAILVIGLCFAGIFAFMGLMLLVGWVIVIGAFAAASYILGVSLILGLNVAGLIPAMPYFASLMLGISLVALGVLSSVGTIYTSLYSIQWVKLYFRWTKNTMNGGIYPPLSKHPILDNKVKRRLRGAAIFSLAIFGILFVGGFISLMVYTGFKPFWHEFSWFVG